MRKSVQFGLMLCVFSLLCQKSLLGAQFSTKSTAANSSASSSRYQSVEDNPLRLETVREYLRLSGVGEIFRNNWLSSFDRHRSQGEPYWPESFWADMRHEMVKADLAPMVLELYSPNIPDEMLRSANEFLKTGTMADLASIELGSRLCKLQQEDDMRQAQLMSELTESIMSPVYDRHKREIKAARAKYIAEHPDYKDR